MNLSASEKNKNYEQPALNKTYVSVQQITLHRYVHTSKIGGCAKIFCSKYVIVPITV